MDGEIQRRRRFSYLIVCLNYLFIVLLFLFFIFYKLIQRFRRTSKGHQTISAPAQPTFLRSASNAGNEMAFATRKYEPLDPRADALTVKVVISVIIVD